MHTDVDKGNVEGLQASRYKHTGSLHTSDHCDLRQASKARFNSMNITQAFIFTQYTFRAVL